MELTSNQVLIFGNLGYFDSSTLSPDIIIGPSHWTQSFLVVVKVDTDDHVFIITDDDFDFGDLFGRVEGVTDIEVT